jgi:glycosyltransferase involved in cell wall biosynthesis
VRILQVFSDWKWTGPAAPMLLLLQALRERGHEVWLACPPPPPDETGLEARARAAGAPPELSLSRGRGVRLLADAPDARRLRECCEARDVEIVHAWHTRDHVLGLRAAARRRRAGRTALVRSVKSAEPIAATPWNRWLYGPGSEALLCVSPGAARANARLRGERPLAGAFGAFDPSRFGPAPQNAALKAELGHAEGERVVGIVARAQRHRRFDLLLEAARRWMAADPLARLLVIGRGTHIEETARQPAQRLGIGGRVVFAGYRGDDYADALRLCDVLTLLVPGSDGGCRAVLEAAACGIPAVTTRRGALPEIVQDGRTGMLVEERPESLCEAWRALFADAPRRARRGAAARERALACFTPARLAEAAEALYRRALAAPATRRSGA